MATANRVRKPAARTAAKHITTPAKSAAKTPPNAPAAKTESLKAAKPAKDKRVRDTFVMPKSEFVALAALKSRAAKAGAASKKSVLIRAGLRALALMSDTALAAAVRAVPTDKPGSKR